MKFSTTHTDSSPLAARLGGLGAARQPPLTVPGMLLVALTFAAGMVAAAALATAVAVPSVPLLVLAWVAGFGVALAAPFAVVRGAVAVLEALDA